MFGKIKQKNGRLANSKAGFFIAELIVATFIFSIVMTVSIGALLIALDANKKTQSLKSVLNNLNVALDTMTKAIAVGSYYNCGSSFSMPHVPSHVADCPLESDLSGGEGSISFLFNEDLDSDGFPNDVVSYAFEPGDGEMDGYISRTIYHSNGQVIGPIRMTAPGVNITNLRFYVTGSETVATGNFITPKVLIVIEGNSPAGPRSAPTEYRVQTLVTQRIPDFE